MSKTENPAGTDQDYSAASIQVLKGLDAVRKRPGMYIGDTDDGSGLHRMVYEVVNNAIDESLAGHCDAVLVTLDADGSVTVEDNGRGIPTDIHPTPNMSVAEVIMTQLYAGGNFNQISYKIRGVGVSVVNALSSRLELTVWRNGKEHSITFNDGVVVEPLKVVGDCPGRTGTRITFTPSADIFTNFDFNYTTLEHRLRELAFLNPGVHIILSDLRGIETRREDMRHESGLEAFARYLDRSRQALITTPIIAKAERDGVMVEAALWWNDSRLENTQCFTNCIPQRNGGTHLTGFRAALTRAINTYAQESGFAKDETAAFTGNNIRQGLTCVLSVRVPYPQFSGATREKLASPEVRPVVNEVISKMLRTWFEEHPDEGKTIMRKIAGFRATSAS